MPRQIQYIFSENQGLSGAVDTNIASTNIVKEIDFEDYLGNAITPDEGDAARLYLEIIVVAAVVMASGGYIELNFSSLNTDNPVPDTWAEKAISAGAIRLPDTTEAGKRFYLKIPTGKLDKYQGIQYIPRESALTSATITAQLTIDRETPSGPDAWRLKVIPPVVP